MIQDKEEILFVMIILQAQGISVVSDNTTGWFLPRTSPLDTAGEEQGTSSLSILTAQCCFVSVQCHLESHVSKIDTTVSHAHLLQSERILRVHRIILQLTPPPPPAIYFASGKQFTACAQEIIKLFNTV